MKRKRFGLPKSLIHTPIYCAEAPNFKMELRPIPESKWFRVVRTVEPLKGSFDPDTGKEFVAPK